jgi:hypothetical protein
MKPDLTLSLSPEIRQDLRQRWNDRVKDEFAFTPFELKEEVSVADATFENVALGKFSSEYLKNVLRSSTSEDRLRRLSTRGKIVAIGYGRGYDGDWLKEAIGEACLETWWIDVSDQACEWAEEDLAYQIQELKPSTTFRYPDYKIKREEIHTALEDPGSIGLDIDTVEIWYLCRVLGCLSHRSAKFVLEAIGSTLSEEHDPEKKKKIVLVLALKNDNPDRIGSTSTMYKRGFVLGNIELGANRPVKVSQLQNYRYFTQIYTAMTVMAE